MITDQGSTHRNVVERRSKGRCGADMFFYRRLFIRLAIGGYAWIFEQCMRNRACTELAEGNGVPARSATGRRVADDRARLQGIGRVVVIGGDWSKLVQ